MMTCNYWQDYFWLFTGEDLNFGHVFGSCIKTVPLLRTCPLPYFKNDNVMAVSRISDTVNIPEHAVRNIPEERFQECFEQ